MDPMKVNGRADIRLVNIALVGYIVLEIAVICYVIKLVTK